MLTSRYKLSVYTHTHTYTRNTHATHTYTSDTHTHIHTHTYTRTYTHKHIHTQHAQTGVSSVLGLSPAVLGMLRHQSSHPLLLPSLKMAA